MNRHTLKYIFILFFCYSIKHFSQTYNSAELVSDTLLINLNNSYNLSSVTIIPFSEKIKLGDKYLNKKDYNFNYEKCLFTLSDSLQYSIFDTLIVNYKTIKLGLRKTYQRRTLVQVFDRVLNENVTESQSTLQSLSSESLFGSNMQKNGTILRGFTVGTTKDFSVQSGLRLQLSGKLSENIELVAALTDENTPIQPEGNTERLDELDKVFIQIKHTNATGTFGDYDLRYSGTEFGNLKRKLQGLKGEIKYKSHKASVAIAASRGKFNSNQLSGIDGVQGPYRLSGENNEQNIIIIAGSERVYLDGELLKRGENNDYVIEYSNAEITFTTKRLITSVSRIIVDFEYTNRQFKRNFMGASYNGSFINDLITFKMNLVSEGDDKDSPIDITISDEEKKILVNAGNDKLKAVISGVTLATPDSNGIRKGLYSKITSIDGEDTTIYYKYLPGEETSIYNLVFTYVGTGKGDYKNISIGEYYFIGKGEGDYLPVKLLAIPQKKQFGNFTLSINPYKNLLISGEFAASIWDKNTFSDINNNQNFGLARNINISLNPTDIVLKDKNFGKIGFSFRDRYIDDKFSSLDRISNIEFDRDYNIDRSILTDESLREADIKYLPNENSKFVGSFGFVRRGSMFSSKRYLLKGNIDVKNKYDVAYLADYVSTENYGRKTDWLRQDGHAYFTTGLFRPGIIYLSENKKSYSKRSDSLDINSLKLFEIGPSLNIVNLFGVSLTGKFTYREEFSPKNGKLIQESKALTHGYSLIYKKLKEFNTKFDFTYRKKNFSNDFSNSSNLNSETILIRSLSRFNLFKGFSIGDLYYETATEKSAKLQRVFVRVPKGTGNYLYLGDLNENGIADENEFEPTIYDGDYIRTTIPTDELFPIIKLKLNTRWRFNFSKIISSSGFISKIVRPISTETVWRVEERNTTTNLSDIYFLNFDKFLSDSTTLKGNNYFQQDIYLFRNKSDLSFRFRFTQRKNLVNYNSGIEKGYLRERSIRIRFRLVKEIANQTDFISTSDNNIAPIQSNRAREIETNELSTDFSYRPINQIEFGFKIVVSRNTDKYPSSPTIIDQNSQLIRFTYSFAQKGRARLEFERNELLTNTDDNYIPFEILKGNRIGKNYIWRINFDYKFTKNLQSTISYDGRIHGDGKVINTMRAEARAYF